MVLTPIMVDATFEDDADVAPGPSSSPELIEPSEGEQFQLTCPGCASMLLVTLQTEITSVQCSSCHDVFDVQMPPLAADEAPTPHVGQKRAWQNFAEPILPPTWQNLAEPILPLSVGLAELDSQVLKLAHHLGQVEQVVSRSLGGLRTRLAIRYHARTRRSLHLSDSLPPCRCSPRTRRTHSSTPCGTRSRSASRGSQTCST